MKKHIKGHIFVVKTSKNTNTVKLEQTFRFTSVKTKASASIGICTRDLSVSLVVINVFGEHSFSKLKRIIQVPNKGATGPCQFFRFSERELTFTCAICCRPSVCLSWSVGSPYMLSDRCLSCLSLTFVFCGQTVRWIKMKLGMQVGLGPGLNVLDGDRAPPKK